MDREERQMLEETLALAKDSNKKVNKLYRSAQWGKFFRIIYWLVIIIAAIAAYMFIQPYIVQLGEIYGDAKGKLQSAGEVLDTLDSANKSIEEAESAQGVENSN